MGFVFRETSQLLEGGRRTEVRLHHSNLFASFYDE